MNTQQLKRIVLGALGEAHAALEDIAKTGTDEVHDSHVTDISTKGDRVVSNSLINFFKKQKIPAVLFSEESDRIELFRNPRYTITIDDIDGTDNYYHGRGLLPYCTIVMIFDSVNPKFRDAHVAGIIEHNSNTVWYAVRDEGCYQNFAKVKTSGREVLDRRTLVIVDHYSNSSEISKFLDVYPTSWVKDFGTTGLHMAGVSNGLFDAFVSLNQKGHEIGAGYLLVKEAKGSFTDFEGKPFDDVLYDFNGSYSVVAAATEELGRKILTKIGE
jgi:myo-inositol-1(or 4)-monophosphatase